MEPKDNFLNAREWSRFRNLKMMLLEAAAEMYATSSATSIEGMKLTLNDVERTTARLRVLLEDADIRANKDEDVKLGRRKPRKRKLSKEA